MSGTVSDVVIVGVLGALGDIIYKRIDDEVWQNIVNHVPSCGLSCVAWKIWTDQFIGKEHELELANNTVAAMGIYFVYFCFSGGDDSLHKIFPFLDNSYFFRFFVAVCLVLITYLLWLPKRMVSMDGREVALNLAHDNSYRFRWQIMFVSARMVESIKEFPPFQRWLKNMGQFETDKFEISCVVVQWVDWNEDGQISFLKIRVAVQTKVAVPNQPIIASTGALRLRRLSSGLLWEDEKKGKDVPGVVLMGGPTVAVLVLLADGKDVHAVTVQQARIAVPCTSMREIPSKTVVNCTDFEVEAQAIVKRIPGFENDICYMIDMTDWAYKDQFEGVYPTPGGSNEYVRMFLYRKELSEEEEFTKLQEKFDSFNSSSDLQFGTVRYSHIPFECVDLKLICAAAIYDRMATVNPNWAVAGFSEARKAHPPATNISARREVGPRSGFRYQKSCNPADGASESKEKIEKATTSPKFKGWEAKLQKEMNDFRDHSTIPYPDSRLSSLEIEGQSMDYFGDNLGFFKFKASVAYPKEISGNVFMRGGSVGILVLLQDEEKLYTVVVHQARVPVGSPDMVEIPAGMFDSDGNMQLTQAVVRALEEIGLTYDETALINMSNFMVKEPFTGYFPACDKSDEFAKFYLYYQKISTQEQDKWRENLEGQRGNWVEEDYIRAEIILYEELFEKSSDAKALCGAYMYESLLRFEQLPAYVPRPPAPRTTSSYLVSLSKKLTDGDGSAWFDEFDKEPKDNQLDLNELKKGLADTLLEMGSGSLGEKAIGIVTNWFVSVTDKNQNGQIDRAEFRELREILLKWRQVVGKEIAVGDRVLQCRVDIKMLGHVIEPPEDADPTLVRVKFEYLGQGGWFRRGKAEYIGEDSFKLNELILIEKKPSVSRGSSRSSFGGRKP